jgi:hypothetical protein
MMHRQAQAARGAIVDLDALDVRQGPGPRFKSLEKLGKGDPVTASNQPIEGYYKVRTASGTIGFVPADTLVLQPTHSSDEGAPAAALPAPQTAAPEAVKPVKSPAKSAPKPARLSYPGPRIKALGGYDFFDVGDVNDHLSANVLRFGYGAGLELEYPVMPWLAAVARVEYLFKAVAAHDGSTNKDFEMSVSSWPIVLGAQATLLTWESWSAHASLLAGLAPLTRISATSTSDSEPNVTEFSALGYTGVAKLDVAYSLNATWAFFAEAGYRYLTTSAQTPSLEGAGSSIFQSGGEYVPIRINLSGPFVGLGVALAF